MALNISYALRYVKRMIGATHFPLPIEDDDIIEIIKQESLYTFSKYYPFQFNIKVDHRNLTESEGIYLLDSQGLEILGVSRVLGNENFDYGYYGDCCYGYANNIMSPVEALNQQIITDLVSMSQVPFTFNFIPPNRVEVFPKQAFRDNLLVTLKTVHPDHLSTIPLSMREEFLRLCLYDVRISLWQILRQYSDINTAVGQFNLKLEDYERAEEDRKELLERFQTNYIKEANRKKIYIG